MEMFQTTLHTFYVQYPFFPENHAVFKIM